MEIPQSDASRIIERLRAVEANGRFRNLAAQVHSRSILQGLNVSADSWPRYTIPENDLHDTAHYLLWQGLQLRSLVDYREQANAAILRACEILEFLYQSQPSRYRGRTEQLFNAALGYYIAGYYARAYVLMRQLTTVSKLPSELEVLRRFLEKNLIGVRELVSSILEDAGSSDAVIARQLQERSLSEDDALDRIMRSTFGRVFSYFIEFPKTGQYSLVERAREVANDGLQLALKTGFADWWWWFYCVRHLLDEYDESSLWRTLSPLDGDDPTSVLVRPYIRANYARSIPVTELWPSQRAALPYINDLKRGSYCLKMPTSAGKTRIAEIAILRFLLDNRDEPNTKCIYLAPFRSLAVEIEASLQQSFAPLGVRVSELYGGFELSPIERYLLEETRILIATPEKIDAFLRYNPELDSQIRLIIIDEGHIISLTERGIKYELFLHRLIRRFASSGVRLLFISAVLPNTEEFSEWITGDPGDVIQSRWRPSRILIGELRWDGRVARIDYLEADHNALEHECYIPNFISPIDPRALQSVGFRRRFPNDIKEVVAEAGARFAQQGPTMIFCALKASARPVAESIVRSLAIHGAMNKDETSWSSLPTSAESIDAIRECIALADEHMGTDNDVAKYLRKGFAIHHSDIPKQVRIKLEQLFRTNAINLIVATTTLAQGVNLPVQTVIVHGLSHGQEDLTPVTFWNICGRAGRGMRENQGQVLFTVDLHMPNVKLNKASRKGKTPTQIARRTEYKRQSRIAKLEGLRRKIVQGYRDYYLRSALHELLEQVFRNWRKAFPHADLATLCTHLAENNLSWVGDDDNTRLRQWLKTLDAELIALVEESKSDEPISPDLFQRLLVGSLLYLQAGKVQDAQEEIRAITEMLFARWRYIKTVTRTPERQQRFYRLGFPLNDCDSVERHVTEMLRLLMEAEGFEDWDADRRCEYLIGLTGFLLQHVSILAPKSSPCINCAAPILRLWLLGYSPNEIVRDHEVAEYTDSPSVVSKFIEDVFDYKLPWGLNALNAYMGAVIENSELTLPGITSYFSALVKYGVHSPVASCLLALGLGSRKLALKLAQVYTSSSFDMADVILWLLLLSNDQLAPLRLSKQETEILTRAKHRAKYWSGSTTSAVNREHLVLPCKQSPELHGLSPGDVLLLVPRPDMSSSAFLIRTLWGSEIGVFDYGRRIPVEWTNSERLIVKARNLTADADPSRVQLEIEIETL